MPAFSHLTEQALRAAVNHTGTEFKGGTKAISQLKETALKRINELVNGHGNAANISSELNLQNLAIGTAIQGLELSYFAVKGQLEQLKDKRLCFDKERLGGIATFIIPTHIEEKNLSTQEQIIKAFINAAHKKNDLFHYLGIQVNTSVELEQAEFYSILPFYKMSEALAQPIASKKTIDKQRTTINLFFRSILPNTLKEIDITFQTENKFIEFFKSSYAQGNYLNDLRAPRFIMLALANLLWNLQHPMDPETGFPLSTARNIELCREVELFINALLNNNENTYLKELNYMGNTLLSFVRKVETHIKSLRVAFIEEHLYELNVSDLAHNAHQTLRTMDKSIFELIYKNKDPLAGKERPDSKAAEELAYSVSYLNQLLINAPDLLPLFTLSKEKMNEIPFINQDPITIIDVLIRFIHYTEEEKLKLYAMLNKEHSDHATEFLSTLQHLNKKYLSPIIEVCHKELNSSLLQPKHRAIAQLTARRFIPLMTLVLEDYTVSVDRPNKESNESPVTSPLYSASEQIKKINTLANIGKGYYVWELSPFITLHKETEEGLDQLPHHQYRFTEITQLLDAINEIVQNYRTFLQHKSFQNFLIRCLNKIKSEYSALEHYIARVDSFLSNDKTIGRSIQAILAPMNTDLTASLEHFSSSFSHFEQIISAPDFTEQQKNILSMKIEAIHQQFNTLFEEDSGILELSPANSPSPPGITLAPLKPKENKPSSPSVYVDPKRIIELRKLITSCRHALSLGSYYGNKGRLLTRLLTLIDNKVTLTFQEELLIITELGKITLSYRPTCFFQAAYAETRSGKIFIAALNNAAINKILPLSSLVFNQHHGSTLTPKECIKQLKILKETNEWPEDSMQLTALT
ncbi:MAG: hypothetical protein CK426_04770 [Legionella sp.]|nr:MAG: hypothetical protein CK423_04135 [Legionella sp.]PJD98801.1 MAG: hypothetical protein CK426_04770 [Legionella sp.]